MQLDEAKLDFAYKYPFSKEAKEIIESMGISSISDAYLKSAKSQIELALGGRIEYKRTNISSVKLDYILNYAYCRMLLSAYANLGAIRKYAEAEAARSAEALSYGSEEELLALGRELNVRIEKRFKPESKGEFALRFDEFLKYASGAKGMSLVNQKLDAGAIVLEWNEAVKFMELAIRSKISEGLPAKVSELPKEVLSFAKLSQLRMPIINATKGAVQRGWIERLLNTPIPDVRHRTVNLILAPYLVNVKGLSPEEASKVINDYIARCKELNPDTRITEKYVEYQCNYAKRKGTKPLSEQRARELLSGIVDIWND